MTWYTEIPCTNVDQFIEAIDSTRSGFLAKNSKVYRGHADSTWELRPTLYRKRYGGMEFEHVVVRNFMLHANRNGLVIPADAMSFESPLNKHTGFPAGNYRTSRDIKYDVSNIAFAMARHAEIPTRHLDFSFDPLVATWFAVNDDKHLSKHERPNRLGVWAFDHFKLYESFGLIHHDWTYIPSLRNQKGVFVYDMYLDVDSIGCWTKAPSFDAALSKIEGENWARIITVPTTVSNLTALNEYLMRRGITTANILPTYENVRCAVMSQFKDASTAVERKSPQDPT